MTLDRDLDCAEYVLGLLDSQERKALERALDQDAALRDSVSAWEARLSPLGEDAVDMVPPARVWKRIQADLGHVDHSPAPAPEPLVRRIWNSIGLWRTVALVTSVATVTAVALNLSLFSSTATAPDAKPAYIAAAITDENGLPHWTMTIDTAKREIVVVPAVALRVAESASTELWLIPENSKPISLGVFASDRSTSIPLSRENAAKLNARAILAVSLEPKGGSPTGQATGPIVGKGAMHDT
ncbi:anti-sigma factor [Ralstonia insidiosa]|uniref:RNA polymerase subunit sigma-70 n=1 Tax=Ralstonia insidiosa TaxID=190721 RepID=A0A848P3S5_9RALS|nr:anti-sigma factor [Ralstonia insidiosa]NMV40189.1 RNA polymerase subunit sigma-70 [Ralstonia insidiosa]